MNSLLSPIPIHNEREFIAQQDDRYIPASSSPTRPRPPSRLSHIKASSPHIPHFDQDEQPASTEDFVELYDDYFDNGDDENEADNNSKGRSINESKMSILSLCLQKSTESLPKSSIAPLLSEINSIKVQESLIVKDLFSVLLGSRGNYIQFSKNYDTSIISSRIQGPDFKFAKYLDLSLKGLTRRISAIGKHYIGLKEFILLYDNERHGKIVQRYCQFVAEFLNYYHAIILAQEKEFHINADFSLSLFDQFLQEKVANKIDHLHKITLEVFKIDEERTRELELDYMQTNVDFEERNSNESRIFRDRSRCCKGGLLLRAIQERMLKFKGDLTSYEFLSHVFDETSTVFVTMLNQWLTEGVINDPFDEFMICVAKLSSKMLQLFRAKSEFYWNELFYVKQDGLLLQFQNKQIQRKVLDTGKYLSIFKLCTRLQNFEALQESLPEPIKSLNAPDTELKIDLLYQRANNLLLKLLFEGYNIRGLFSTFQTTFLLDNSFNVDTFIASAFSELKRNRYQTSISNTEKIYQTVFRMHQPDKIDSSSSRMNIAEMVKRHQNFKIVAENFFKVIEDLMGDKDFTADTQVAGSINTATAKAKAKAKASPPSSFLPSHTTANTPPNTLQNILQDSKNGKEITQTNKGKHAIEDSTFLSVDLSVLLPFPLNLVLVRQTSYQYEILFKFVFMLKFVAHQGETVWKELNFSQVWNAKSHTTQTRKWIMRCRVLQSRILALVSELQEYVASDVTESAYTNLQSKIAEYEKEVLAKDLISDYHAIGKDQSNNSRNGNGSGNGISNSNSRSNNTLQSSNFETRNFNNARNGNSIFDINIGKRAIATTSLPSLSSPSQLSSSSSLSSSSTAAAAAAVDGDATTQTKSDSIYTVSRLVQELGSYTTTLLNDSLLTRPETIQCIKDMIIFICKFHHYTAQMRRHLILINPELQQAYARDYPERFNKEMDATLIANRFSHMTETFYARYILFGELLGTLMNTIKSVGEKENKKLLVLSERLEACFPD